MIYRWFAQWIFDSYNSPLPKRYAKRLFVSRCYKFLERQNPLVRGTLNGREIVMPFAHKLLKYRQEFKNYDTRLRQLNQALADMGGGRAQENY